MVGKHMGNIPRTRRPILYDSNEQHIRSTNRSERETNTMTKKYKHIAISEELHYFITLRKAHHKMGFEEYLIMISTQEANDEPKKIEFVDKYGVPKPFNLPMRPR